MEARARLERLERIIDAAGVAARIEALLPVGVRRRQLSARTLLVGMVLLACEGRPAHLSRVHEALLALPEPERRRLGVVAEWRSGLHELTYRQVERTFSLVAGALAKDEPDGSPSEALGEILEALLEAAQPAGLPRPAPTPLIGPTPRASRGRRRRRGAAAPTPRPPGGTGAATPPARQTRPSSATTCRW